MAQSTCARAHAVEDAVAATQPVSTQPADARAKDVQIQARETLREMIARAFATPTAAEQDHLTQMLNEAENLQYLADRIEQFTKHYPQDEARDELEIARLRAVYLSACLTGRPPRQLYAESARVGRTSDSTNLRRAAEYWLLRKELDRLHARGSRKARIERAQLMVQFVDQHPDSTLAVPLLEQLYEYGVAESDEASIEHALRILTVHHPDHVTTAALTGRERLRRNTGSLWRPALTGLDSHDFDWNAALAEINIVVFWSPHHVPSVQILRKVARLRNQLDDGRISIIPIAIGGEIGEVESFMQELGCELKAAYEAQGWKGRITREYGIRTLPTLLVLDQGGVLRRILEPHDWTFEDSLPSLFESLLADESASAAGAPSSQPAAP